MGTLGSLKGFWKTSKTSAHDTLYKYNGMDIILDILLWAESHIIYTAIYYNWICTGVSITLYRRRKPRQQWRTTVSHAFIASKSVLIEKVHSG